MLAPSSTLLSTCHFTKGTKTWPDPPVQSSNKKTLFLLTMLFVMVSQLVSFASEPPLPQILPLRTRAEVLDRWLEIRLDTVIPLVMRRSGIDMWVLVAREYNEDPVLETMFPADWFAARRRTILFFFDRGQDKGVERLAVSRYPVGRFFESLWDKEKQPDQWKGLAELIQERKPRKIAVNRSSTFGLADGLASSEYESLKDSLPTSSKGRLVSAENLAVGWLETRVTEEMQVYPTLCRIAHVIIAEGVSEKVITPGITSTQDVEWWYREKIAQLKLGTWFQPSVSVQRESDQASDGPNADPPADRVILPGDLIHVDFGITYLGLNTDTQQNAYVLRAGEAAAPKGLQEGLRQGNRLQDILTAEFKSERSGNTVLRNALNRAKEEGLRPSIYTHPLGYHGHAAGPTIGLWDQQSGVPGQGDYPLYPNTAHSIELNVTVSIPEWNGQDVSIKLEEDAFFDGKTTRYIDGRQTQLFLIPRQR